MGLIVAETLRDGARHGLAVVLGATVVSLIFLTINFFGFASVAALPEAVLDLVRYFGAAYLFYLAYQAITRPVHRLNTPENELPPAKAPAFSSFKKSMIISMTSPKTILFFAAFFPQFVNEKMPVEPQLAVLSIAFLAVAGLMDTCWVLTASKAKKLLTQKNKLSLANKISGGILAAGATLLLFIN